MEIPKKFYENMDLFGSQLIGFTKAACRAMPNEASEAKVVELVGNIVSMAINEPLFVPVPEGDLLAEDAPVEEDAPKVATRKATGRRVAKRD